MLAQIPAEHREEFRMGIVEPLPGAVSAIQDEADGSAFMTMLAMTGGRG